MDVRSAYKLHDKKIRFDILLSLVFCFWLYGCKDTDKTESVISLHWENNQPVNLVVPRKLINTVREDSIRDHVQVKLAKSNTAILGNYSISKETVLFTPLIPFTPGLKYKVFAKGELLAEIDVPQPGNSQKPELVSVYPSQDSLPVNLLKFYLLFSKPMQEGDVLKNIYLVKNGKDTLNAVFLDLQTELWNKDRTMLTLWLDPGRIKRELIPNQRLGNPLERNASYELLIRKDFKDLENNPLSNDLKKEFKVVDRDSYSPDPSKWTIKPPPGGTGEALIIDLHESLDYSLLNNCLLVRDNSGTIIPGNYNSQNEETLLKFTPLSPWKAGNYSIDIESRLEDLAGNNLSKLFDRDISKPAKNEEKKIFKLVFSIR